MSLTEEERRVLFDECRKLPEGKNYRTDDYVINLLATVLDFQMKGEVVDAAMGFYKENRRSELRTHKALAELVASFPNTKTGNMQLAKYLWNNNHWSRAEFLRELLRYFDRLKIRGSRTLSRWASSTEFQEVKGKIKTKEHSVGYAIFKWLQLRLGVDTVKPDVHVKQFVSDCIGRKAKDEETVEAVEVIAKELQIPAFLLDAAIWEHQRNKSIQKRRESIVKKRELNESGMKNH